MARGGMLGRTGCGRRIRGGSVAPYGGRMLLNNRRGDGLGDVIRKIAPFLKNLFARGKKFYERHGDFINNIGSTVYNKYKYEKARSRAKAEANNTDMSTMARSNVVGSGMRRRGMRRIHKKHVKTGRGSSKKYNNSRKHAGLKRHIRGRRMGGSFISNIQPGPLP